jgi:hypothetical protein
MDRIARIGVDERAARDELGAFVSGEDFARRRRRKDVREQEKAKPDAEGRAKHSPHQENRQPAPHPVLPLFFARSRS